MGGTHACLVTVTVTVPSGQSFTGSVPATAVNGVIQNVTVPLLPTTGPNPGPINLQGLPCPLSGSLTITIPGPGGGGPGTTIVITAVD
ncbi:hypothetical protein ASG98_17080 [Bacillus sp. Soil531]|nr:hypothetical protein ASG98_17080 [Bacillus sp. Soil531]